MKYSGPAIRAVQAAFRSDPWLGIPRIAAATLLLLAFSPQARADYFVVVNERNPVTTLTQIEALHLFMGRSRYFPHGGVAMAFDLASDADRDGFYRSLGGVGLSQVNSYWARLKFSGRSLPPQRVDSEAAMIERVRNNPLAVGWLRKSPGQKGLRTVLVLTDNP